MLSLLLSCVFTLTPVHDGRMEVESLLVVGFYVSGQINNGLVTICQVI